MAKTILDYVAAEDKETLDAIVARATEAKANRPKKVRGPRTPEQKLAADIKRRDALDAKIAALMAQRDQNGAE